MNARSTSTTAPPTAAAPDTPTCTLELPYTPPYDWAKVVQFYAGRATPGVEVVEDGMYRRMIEHAGYPGMLKVRAHPQRACLMAQLEGPLARHADEAPARRLAAMFDLLANPAAIGTHFSSDPWLGPLVAATPGLRVPGAWSGFELAVRAIVGQQVSVKAATTLMGRLVQRVGQPAEVSDVPSAGQPGWRFPTPEALACGDLGKIGMPGKRVAALQGMARAVADGRVPLDLGAADPAEVRAAWLALPGIGPWTVEYIAMRAWRDADAWPGTDLILKQAITHFDPDCATPGAQRRRAEAWRPWRAYAALHLWHSGFGHAGTRGG